MHWRKQKEVLCPKCGQPMCVSAIAYIPQSKFRRRKWWSFVYGEHVDYECPDGHRTGRPPYVIDRKK